MKLSLGPLLYYWPRKTVQAFYRAIEDAPVDTVYLGETVCARRHEIRFPDWLAIARRLQGAGKEVHLCTQTLIESASDIALLHKITDNNFYQVEANDMGAVHCMAGRKPFIAGAHLNIYNLPTLQWLASLGARRWVVPLEMGRDDLVQILRAKIPDLETEVFAFGRMPLAFSARCFTARHHGRTRDDCEFNCLEDPDGLTMETLEGERFLVLNGTQIQSASTCVLLDEVEYLKTLGVDVIRVSPQGTATLEILNIFSSVVHHSGNPETARNALLSHLEDAPCNGYWHGGPGLSQCQNKTLRQPDL